MGNNSISYKHIQSPHFDRCETRTLNKLKPHLVIDLVFNFIKRVSVHKKGENKMIIKHQLNECIIDLMVSSLAKALDCIPKKIIKMEG